MDISIGKYQKLKEELHNKLAQGWIRYPKLVEKAYTMLCKRRDNGTPRITTELQLAFNVEREGDKDKDSGEEIVPLLEVGMSDPTAGATSATRRATMQINVLIW
eukprot:13226730-Ditylum_brightwellii.AAC.1